MNKETLNLNELLDNKSIQKNFFNEVLNLILDSKVKIYKVSGNKIQLQVVKNAILESKKFHDELFNPNTTIDMIVAKMNSKNLAIKEFEKLFKIKWLF